MFLTKFNIPKLQQHSDHYKVCIFIEGSAFANVNSCFFSLPRSCLLPKKKIPL